MYIILLLFDHSCFFSFMNFKDDFAVLGIPRVTYVSVHFYCYKSTLSLYGRVWKTGEIPSIWSRGLNFFSLNEKLRLLCNLAVNYSTIY